MENVSRPVHQKTLAAFGADGKFWNQNGQLIELKFKDTRLVDPLILWSPSTRDAVWEADVLFLSTPDDTLAEFIEESRDLLAGKELIDNHTIKDEALLAEARAAGAQVCSIHTMVKTDSPHQGHTMLTMPFDSQCTDALNTALQIADALEMKTVQLPLEQHKHAVTELQAIDHFLARLGAITIMSHCIKHELPSELINTIISASQKLSGVARNRILLQDPEVSADIMSHGKAFLETFVPEMVALTDGMISSRDELLDVLEEHSILMGLDTEWKASMQKITDSLIRLL